jgi:hypothetical protein
MPLLLGNPQSAGKKLARAMDFLSPYFSGK